MIMYDFIKRIRKKTEWQNEDREFLRIIEQFLKLSLKFATSKPTTPFRKKSKYELLHNIYTTIK